MSWLDRLLGRTPPVKPKPDRLFAISTATITLQVKLGLKPSGRAAIVFKPTETSYFEEAQREIEVLLGVSREATGTQYDIEEDELGYLWVVLGDPDFEDLVASTHVVSQTLVEHGFGDRLLAAVYPFKSLEDDHRVYWVFTYKRGVFYPFVPTGDRERDHSRELRVRAVMRGELPIEEDTSRWYPLWDAPI